MFRNILTFLQNLLPSINGLRVVVLISCFLLGLFAVVSSLGNALLALIKYFISLHGPIFIKSKHLHHDFKLGIHHRSFVGLWSSGRWFFTVDEISANTGDQIPRSGGKWTEELIQKEYKYIIQNVNDVPMIQYPFLHFKTDKFVTDCLYADLPS